MKKLLVVLVILTFVVSVSARDDLNIWYGGDFDGGGWNNIQDAGLNKWIEIPVFFMGNPPEEVFVGDMCLPLGINLAYLDAFNADDCYFVYPFTEWGISEFRNENPGEEWDCFDPMPGWNSLTFAGNARFVDPNAPLGHWETPTLGLIFMVHTVDNEALLDSTVCAMMDGCDPYEGPPNVGDSIGGEGYNPITMYACLYFSPNQPPIIDPAGSFALPYDCGYADFTVDLEVWDPDGDPVTLEATVGTWTLTSSEYDGEGAVTHTFTGDFDMEDFCGLCFSGDLSFIANDGQNDPVFSDAYPIAIVGEITASMNDALELIPGETAWMPVYLNVCGPCFCLGGFTLTVGFDASVLSVTDVMLGDALMGGEYWNINYGVDGPGTVRFVFINDLNDQNPADPICGLDPEEAIFSFEMLLAVYDYPVDFVSPVCFTGDFYANSVSDDGGYHVWIPDGCDDAPDSSEYGTMLLTLNCGNVMFLDVHNIMLGDINLNGHPFEIGDVVLLANHLIDPAAYPLDMRQMFASDVNEDGLQATIADLIFMINRINGQPVSKVAPLDVVATVSMPIDAYGSVDVMISSATNVGGALVSINHNGVELGVPVAEGMDLGYTDNGEVMTVVVYDMDANSFAPGSNVLFTIPVLSEGELTFGDVSISDNRGALLDARSELTAPLPTEFTVSQNFPNPFNARTKINFAIPGNANVRIDIYNVAGQLVEAIDMGYTNAGQHSVVWDASDIASGVYFYKVTYGNDSRTMNMTLLK